MDQDKKKPEEPILCNHCQKEIANVKVAFSSENGIIVEEHYLCSKCASVISPQLSQAMTKEDFRDLMSTFFGSDVIDKILKLTAGDGDDFSLTPDKNKTRCLYCGMTLKQFIATRTMGCPHCYDAFTSFYEDLLGAPEPNKRVHTGQRPENAGSVSRRALLTARRKMLQRRLEFALDHEDYIAANKINQKLKKLDETK